MANDSEVKGQETAVPDRPANTKPRAEDGEGRA